MKGRLIHRKIREGILLDLLFYWKLKAEKTHCRIFFKSDATTTTYCLLCKFYYVVQKFILCNEMVPVVNLEKMDCHFYLQRNYCFFDNIYFDSVCLILLISGILFCGALVFLGILLYLYITK